MTTSLSPLGLHRVLDPPGVLPQAAWRLDPSAPIAPDEVRVRVDRLNLDAASYRQLRETYAGDPDKVRAAVLEIIATRGKMQNPVTGSGGMLTGTVEEAGPDSPLGLKPGQRIATLVSLTLTPLVITDSLARWDGQSEQIPCEGHAILFARPGRSDRGVRRRHGLRGRRDPVHRPGRHRDLLLDGDLVQRRRARRRGHGRGRDHADRQRVCARACSLRP
jgi:hypothetical protein